MKYNLLIRSLINELSSNINAANAMIKATKDNIQIPISIVTKNAKKFRNPYRGNAHRIANIINQETIPTVKILITFLKNP